MEDYLHRQTQPFRRYRHPQNVFELAIAKGILSLDKKAGNYVGHYMYMYDDAQERSCFKNIITREYLPPVHLHETVQVDDSIFGETC